MKSKILGLLAVGLLAGPTASIGGEIGFTFSDGGTQQQQTLTYGFDFTPVANIYLDGLGFFDYGADGLAAAHRVGVWDSAGNLLASTSVSAANSTLMGPTINGSGQYRFVSIADVLLMQGLTYRLGAAIEGATDRWYAGGTQIGNPNLASVSATGLYGECLFCRPTLTIGNTYGAGSFTARLAAVPEPGTLALLGLGLLGLGVTRRKAA